MLKTSLRRVLMLSFLLSLACAHGCGLTLGPTVAREFIIVKPGFPIVVLENRTVTGQRLDGEGPAEVDIGGWIAMPPEHWNAVTRNMEKGN